jgi:hypothetical protein
MFLYCPLSFIKPKREILKLLHVRFYFNIILFLSFAVLRLQATEFFIYLASIHQNKKNMKQKSLLNTSLFIVMLLLFSCSKEQVTPNDLKHNVKEKSGLSTTCYICSNAFHALPSCSSCGGSYSGTYTTLGSSYHYPSKFANICPNTTSITVTVVSNDVPNNFTITYLDKNGNPVSSWNSDWMGALNFNGPWGGSIPRNTLYKKDADVVTTTAQQTPWPCPFVLPNSSASLYYQNVTGTPANGVTWTILSNNPAGSASLVGNGAINETVNFSSSFNSVQLQAASHDPSPAGGFQNCNTLLTISAPTLSNIASVKIDVWTITPPVNSGINPNTDSWEVTVGCIKNTSGSNCAQCY